MIEFHLRADSEAAMAASLSFAISPDGQWIAASHLHAFDPIGAVAISPPVLDGEGQIVVPAIMDPRFHANLRLLDHNLAELVPEAMRIDVTSPCRVWA